MECATLTHSDLKLDIAYRVVSGDNGTLSAGDIIWVDSASKALNFAKEQGWLQPEECTDDIFSGVVIEPALDLAILTRKGHGTKCRSLSAIKT